MSDTIRVAAIQLAKTAVAEMRGGPIVEVSPERSEKILAILFDSVLDKYDEERAAHERTRTAVDHLAERVREVEAERDRYQTRYGETMSNLVDLRKEIIRGAVTTETTRLRDERDGLVSRVRGLGALADTDARHVGALESDKAALCVKLHAAEARAEAAGAKRDEWKAKAIASNREAFEAQSDLARLRAQQQPTADVCQCTHEQGDSDCPVHPACHHCGELPIDKKGEPLIAGLRVENPTPGATAQFPELHHPPRMTVPDGEHDWAMLYSRTTNSGKTLFRCMRCDRESPAPDKGKCKGQPLPQCVRDWQALSFDDRCVNITTERNSWSQATITAQHVLQWAKGLAAPPQPEPKKEASDGR